MIELMSILWITLKNLNFTLVHSKNTPNEKGIVMCRLHMLKKLTILNVLWVLGLVMCGRDIKKVNFLKKKSGP